MIDFHQLVVNAVTPVKVRPSTSYIAACVTQTTLSRFEVKDCTQIIVPNGSGTGVIENPTEAVVQIFHLGNALTTGPRKINNLPSACDLILHTASQLLAIELTESNERAIEGVPGAPYPGKMEKARNQLSSTVSLIEQTGYQITPLKKSAVFFFRLPTVKNELAARTLNAFRRRPTLHQITSYTVPEFPQWEFFNHPYPLPFTLG